MKNTKNNKLLFAIGAGAVALVVLLVTILSFISHNFLAPLKNFSFAEISRDSSVAQLTISGSSQASKERRDQLKKAIDQSGFSYMQGILEGRWAVDPVFEYVKNSDGDNEVRKVYRDELNTVTPSDGEYMLVLSYGALQTIKVEGKSIKFNTIKLIVSDSRNEIRTIKAYAFNLQEMMLNDPDAEYRNVNPFFIYANSTPLYSALKDLMS